MYNIGSVPENFWSDSRVLSGCAEFSSPLSHFMIDMVGSILILIL
ncbi:hypothetical protein HanIR_Chr03g0101301 [Helianthus annuus]|nr:hypothetical protein HanIR_Chr03g0101301 [Helianthus annuus]